MTRCGLGETRECARNHYALVEAARGDEKEALPADGEIRLADVNAERDMSALTG